MEGRPRCARPPLWADWENAGESQMPRIPVALSATPTVRHAMVALALAACASPAAAETMDELYAKAKAEKSVVIYSGGPVAPYESFAAEFQQRFPGVAVSITGGFSNVLNGRRS